MVSSGRDLFLAASDVLRGSQAERFPHEIEQLGMPFVVFKNVFSPKYLPAAEMFARALPFRPGMRFLEIGPGVGVVSVAAGRAGAQVVAIDINEDAVENTHANFVKHGVEAQCEVRRGDIFGSLLPGEAFDLIFWNVPFFGDEVPEVDMLHCAIVDPRYEAVTRYITEGSLYLRAGGRLTIGFSSTVGDLGTIQAIAASAGMKAEIIHSEEVSRFSPVEASAEVARPFTLEILEVSRLIRA